MSAWKKGVVWVNGRNLGRYWSIGPQQRLFCPAPFLKKGKNEIVVLELLQKKSAPVSGHKTLQD
jgi:beta-galactosidase